MIHIIPTSESYGKLVDYCGLLKDKKLISENVFREWAGLLASSIGRGGITFVSKKLGISRNTLTKGREEALALLDDEALPVKEGYVRKEGGGRRPLRETCPELQTIFEEVIGQFTYGNPESEIRYCNMGCGRIADEVNSRLEKLGLNQTISASTVARWLSADRYSKTQNRKLLQVGEPHPQASEQMEYINAEIQKACEEGILVFSMDCKNKIKVGKFRSPGKCYLRQGNYIKVRDHDFPTEVAIPYGCYLLQNNSTLINLGVSKDTAEFAVHSLELAIERHRDLIKNSKILVTCDGGGSNSYRARLWKLKLAELSEKYGIEIKVMHYPRGKSKYNKIEHQVFNHISRSFEGRPLESLEIIKSAIQSTKTSPKGKKGLTVECVLDTTNYLTGIKVPDKLMSRIDITHMGVVPELNYVIRGFKSPSLQDDTNKAAA